MSICVPNIQSASILLSNFIQFLLNRVTLQQTLFHFFMVRCFFVSFFFEQPYIFRIGIWSKSGSFLFIHLIKTELFVTSVAVHFACHCVINCLLAEIGNRSTQLKTIIPTFSSGILSTLHVRAFFFVLSLFLFLIKCRSNFMQISIKSWTEKIHLNTVKGISKWHIYIKPNWQHLKK